MAWAKTGISYTRLATSSVESIGIILKTSVVKKWMIKIVSGAILLVVGMATIMKWIPPKTIQQIRDDYIRQKNIRDYTRIFSRFYEEEEEISTSGHYYNALMTQVNKDLDGNILTTALHLRLFKQLFNRLVRKGEKLGHFEQELYERLEIKLFPWLRKRTLLLDPSPLQQRGIVIPTGEKLLPFAIHTIKALRFLNCTLPIEVFHLGSGDLTDGSQELLRKMENVTLVDIGDHVDMNILDLKGWDIKPFSMLVSSFQEVILMDADVVFVQPPQVMFNYPEYNKMGALFFTDRFLRNRDIDYAAWFKEIIPQPHSKKLENSHMYRAETNYEQESGVVVIDKRKRLIGLLGSCLLNTKRERENIHAKTHGDKETFWLGFEMSGEPYDFVDEQAGAIGVGSAIAMTKEYLLCGHLGHFEKQGQLLWFNDAIVEDKRAPELKVGNFQHVENHGKWHGLCLKPTQLCEIPTEQRDVLDKIKELWDPNPT